MITRDALLGGRLLIDQPASGHRAGTDAVLVAAAGPPNARRIVDLGAGVGTIGLALARANPDAQVTLVEIDPALAALARSNAALNGLDAQITVVETDIAAQGARRGLATGAADAVVTNPPFHDVTRMRVSANRMKSVAHSAPISLLDAWCRAAAAVLAPGGSLTLIHRPDALPMILEALSGRFGAIQLLPVHPIANAPATRLLVRAVKGSRAPLSLLPPLVLHEAGRFTPRAEALSRGDAAIEWLS